MIGYVLICFVVVCGLSLAIAVKSWTFLAFAAVAAVLCLLASTGPESHDGTNAVIVGVVSLAYVTFKAVASWAAYFRRTPRQPSRRCNLGRANAG